MSHGLSRSEPGGDRARHDRRHSDVTRSEPRRDRHLSDRDADPLLPLPPPPPPHLAPPPYDPGGAEALLRCQNRCRLFVRLCVVPTQAQRAYNDLLSPPQLTDLAMYMAHLLPTFVTHLVTSEWRRRYSLYSRPCVLWLHANMALTAAFDVAAELDFLSASFDPLRALYTTFPLTLPNPRALPLDNLSKCRGILPSYDPEWRVKDPESHRLLMVRCLCPSSQPGALTFYTCFDAYTSEAEAFEGENDDREHAPSTLMGLIRLIGSIMPMLIPIGSSTEAGLTDRIKA